MVIHHHRLILVIPVLVVSFTARKHAGFPDKMANNEINHAAQYVISVGFHSSFVVRHS